MHLFKQKDVNVEIEQRSVCYSPLRSFCCDTFIFIFWQYYNYAYEKMERSPPSKSEQKNHVLFELTKEDCLNLRERIDKFA